MTVSIDTNGWTLITPKPDSSFTSWAAQQGSGYTGDGTRFIYCSTSGSGANPGTFASPVKDISDLLQGVSYNTGVGLLRNNNPDWLLLKKGDTWTDDSFRFVSRNGLNAANPLVLSCYDQSATQNPPVPNPYTSTARPLMKITPAYGAASPPFAFNQSSGGNIAVMGVKFYAYTRDPTTASFVSADGQTAMTSAGNNNPLDNFIIEDVYMGFFSIGLVINFGGHNYAPNQSTNLSIRRNQIVRNYSGDGIDVGGVLNGPSGYLLEENLVDHNGWNQEIQNPAAVQSAGTGGTPGTYTNVALTTLTGNGRGAIGDVVVGGGGGVTSITLPVYGGGNFVVGDTFTAPSGSIGGVSGFVGVVTTIYKSGFVHNLYLTSLLVNGDPASKGSPITFNKNVVASEPLGVAFRMPGSFTDNLFIGNVNSFPLDQPYVGVGSTVDSNVFLQNMGGAPALNPQSRYINEEIAAGTAVISNNVLANDLGSSTQGIVLDPGVNGTTLTNNTIYNVSAGNSATALQKTVGSLYAVNVTNQGTLYTDQTVAITQAQSSGGPLDFSTNSYPDGTDYLVLTLSPGMAAVGQLSVVYFHKSTDAAGVIHGPYFTGNQFIFSGVLDTTHIILFGTSFSAVGNFTGTLYFPWYRVPLTGGSGSGAKADLISANGKIVYAWLYGSDTPDDHGCPPGSGYVAGDILSATTALGVNDGTHNAFSNTGGSTTGSGLQITVNSIAVNTDAGDNRIDSGGTNAPAFPDPNRTAGSYCASLGVSPNQTFTASITNGVMTVTGGSPVLNVGDAITWSGQTLADYIKSGTGPYNLASKDNPIKANAGSQTMSSFTFEQLLVLMRGQSKANWNTAWTADAVNTYIRAGFGAAIVLPVTQRLVGAISM